MFRAVFVVAALACASCASPASESSPAPTSARADADVEQRPVAVEPSTPTKSEPVVAAASTASNAGTYVVRFSPAAARMPSNDPFDLELWISESARPDAPIDDVALAVDASMPEHGHGMVRAPIVEQLGPGHFVARGMLLHMTGRWELYFDITRGAVTERAQIDAKLE